ncbi:hypothetical protein U9M48_028513 [Paspalum notatum var. saurae]|uniref:Uncharacterized protein n=1 Tax=Paspalum notatum var. saurae TaxID=547442 RepID=A0AAQ3TXD8_PASNO
MEVDYAEKVLDQAAMKICNDTFSNLRLQTGHPLFEDQPGPYKALCELKAVETWTVDDILVKNPCFLLSRLAAMDSQSFSAISSACIVL